MSKLSEEKIINNMNKLGNIYDEFKKDDEEGHSSAYEMQFEDFESIQGLLDLYTKEKETSHFLQSELDRANAKMLEEKEKNKELEKENWIMRTVDKQYISKDKIREKISALEKIQSEFKNNELLRIKIITLKELLLEEK